MQLADRLIRPVLQAYLATVVIGLGAMASAAAILPPLESVELVATGDRIDGFGRVGDAGIAVSGIDGSGTVLFSGRLSDGRVALFVGDGRGVQTLWQSAPGAPILQVDLARIDEAGRVLAPAASSDNVLSPERLFEVREDGLHSLVAVGDTTAEGNLICRLGEFALNDNGGVVVSALVGATLTDCAAFDVQNAVYLLGDELPRRIAELSSASSERLADLTDDGFAVIASVVDTLVYATDGTSVRPLLDGGLRAPSGQPFQVVSVTQVDEAGRVLLRGYEAGSSGIYLGKGGNLRPIVATFDAAPWGDPIASLSNAGLDGSGNVIVWLVSYPPNGSTASDFGYGVVRHAPDGGETLIARGAYDSQVNRAGQIAAVQEGMGAPDVFRWTGNERVQIVDGDSRAPGGAWYARGGFGPACLAADGRAGMAVNVTEGPAGFVCADSTGLHVIAGSVDRSNFALSQLFQCGFAGEEFVFGANDRESVDWVTIFGADTGGLHRLIGPGDRVDDGSSVESLKFSASGDVFAINERGSIAAAALTDRGLSVLRLRQGAGLESVLPGSIEPSFDQILDTAIAADDTVIAILAVSLLDEFGLTLVVASDGSGSRVLATTGDATLPGGPFHAFDELLAGGSLVWFIGVDHAHAVHVLQYDLSTSQLREVSLPGAAEGSLSLGSVSASGRVLYSTYDVTARAQIYRIVAADGDVELSSQTNGEFAQRLLGFDDAGHILFSVEQFSLGASRISLNLSGAQAAVACPAVEESHGGDEDGCQMTAQGDASICPLWGGLALLVARRRRFVSWSRT